MYTTCSNCNYANLIADLRAYNSVIETASLANFEYLNDALYTEIYDATIGIPTGLNSNLNIVTNDNQLNLIFNNHNVNFYEQVYPNSNNPSLLKTYFLACNDCNLNALKTELDNYNSVILRIENIHAGGLLGS